MNVIIILFAACLNSKGMLRIEAFAALWCAMYE